MTVKPPKPVRVTGIEQADENHVVKSVCGGAGSYMRTPCAECPWRKANVGSFPAQAFRISARTSTDMAQSTFACHMKGDEYPTTCAGFLLSESAHDNLAVRIRAAKGDFIDLKPPTDGELFPTYRQMAIANGVKPNEKVLRDLMPEARQRYCRRRR